MSDVQPLSLRARLAIALRLFAGYCERRGLIHPDITTYLDYLWRFVGLDGSSSAFGEWHAAQVPLVAVGLGDDFDAGFADLLAERGVPTDEFRNVLGWVTEIPYSSLFGASDEPGSRRYLRSLTELVSKYGVPFPALDPFLDSKWIDGHGWGRLVTPAELANWRGDSTT